LRDATVILACRDLKKSQPVLDELRDSIKSAKVELLQLDLGNLNSVRNFAIEFKNKYQRLDILINNAGVMAPRGRFTTSDNFELQFGTNHVGHFLLTTLLIDLLKKSSPSRIINVSSMGHYVGKIHFDDLQIEKKL